jgi:Protein of unknown function (DUF2934)
VATARGPGLHSWRTSISTCRSQVGKVPQGMCRPFTVGYSKKRRPTTMSDVLEIRVERQAGGWAVDRPRAAHRRCGAADSSPISGSVSERGDRARRRQSCFAETRNSICCEGVGINTAPAPPSRPSNNTDRFQGVEMENQKEDRIRRLAYELWNERGDPRDGQKISGSERNGALWGRS